MPVGPHYFVAATGGSSWIILLAVVVLLGAFAVPTLSHDSSPSHSSRLGSPSAELGPSELVHPALPHRSSSVRPSAPAFSVESVGRVARTIFPGFNTSLPGSFTSSVATWQVGTPAFVPSTDTIWFPQRAVSVAGDPVPSVAPAAVFNLTSGQFDRLDTNLSNASALIYDPGNGHLFAAMPEIDSVVVVNPVNGELLGSPIPVGSGPSALCLDPNANMLFVANFASANLTVINILSDKVAVANVSVGADPSSLAFDPGDNLVFVATQGSKSVSVVNATDPSGAVQSIKIFYGPTYAIAYSRVTGNLVVTNPTSDYATILNASTQGVVTSVDVGTGFLSAVSNANGTEFVISNSTGSAVVTLSTANGAVVGSQIRVGPEPSELVLDPESGIVYSWSSGVKALGSLDLVSREAVQSGVTTSPEVVTLSNSPTLSHIFSGSDNNSMVYETSTAVPITTSPVLVTAAEPVSIASDAYTNATFIGTTSGLVEYNGSTGRLDETVPGISGTCSQLVFDYLDNLLWFVNSISGVTALNLTSLRVVISTGLLVPSSVSQGIAVDPTNSEIFVIVSSSSVTVLNSGTGSVMASGVVVGSNVTSVVFDPADDQIYAGGDTVNFIDGATLVMDGGVAPFGGPHRVLTEAYDPSRGAVLVTSIGLLSSKQGTVTVIDGSSVASSEGTTVEIPVGENPAAVAVTPPQGVGGSGLATIWVANELSGTISVIATPPEVSFFAATPATIDLGQQVSIRVVFAGGAGTVTITYQGLPDGCVSADSVELNCTPNTPGDFHLVVNLTDSLGEVANATATLAVMKALAVQVSLTPATLPQVDIGVPVVASASALNGLPPYNYSWSFGDGTVLPGANVSHAYATPGDYSISVQVRDSTGATADSSDMVIVVPRPTVSIGLIPGNATDVDFPVELSAMVTGGTAADDVTWSFGDGTEAVGVNATHAWTRSGTFTVAVHCVDALGVTSNSTVTVIVHPSPTATFSAGNVSAGSPLVVGSPVFFASIVSGGTPPYSVSWAFGDGSMASGASVEHSYGNTGSYRVAVTLIDGVGASVRSNLTVVISGMSAPAAAIASPGGGFATGLFLGLLLGGVVAAVILFAAGPRKGERTPSAPPSPYVPP